MRKLYNDTRQTDERVNTTQHGGEQGRELNFVTYASLQSHIPTVINQPHSCYLGFFSGLPPCLLAVMEPVYARVHIEAAQLKDALHLIIIIDTALSAESTIPTIPRTVKQTGILRREQYTSYVQAGWDGGGTRPRSHQSIHRKAKARSAQYNKTTQGTTAQRGEQSKGAVPQAAKKRGC